MSLKHLCDGCKNPIAENIPLLVLSVKQPIIRRAGQARYNPPPRIGARNYAVIDNYTVYFDDIELCPTCATKVREIVEGPKVEVSKPVKKSSK